MKCVNRGLAVVELGFSWPQTVRSHRHVGCMASAWIAGRGVGGVVSESSWPLRESRAHVWGAPKWHSI